MSYRRLPFEQYFIDTSQDHNHTGKATQELEYTSLSYPCTGRLRKLFHLWHEVNFALRYEAERNVIQIHFQKTLGSMAACRNASGLFVESGISLKI